MAPPEELRELFVLTKLGQSPVRGTLWSHPLGWELRLCIGPSMLRTLVMGEPRDVQSIAEDWKAGFLKTGWIAQV
jgi:hypothetical protein